MLVDTVGVQKNGCGNVEFPEFRVGIPVIVGETVVEGDDTAAGVCLFRFERLNEFSQRDDLIVLENVFDVFLEQIGGDAHTCSPYKIVLGFTDTVIEQDLRVVPPNEPEEMYQAGIVYEKTQYVQEKSPGLTHRTV